jgi:hypothetical protein
MGYGVWDQDEKLALNGMKKLETISSINPINYIR